MLELVIAPALAFGLALLLTPAVRGLAQRLNLVDRPDGRRKLHHRAIPVIGGVGIILAAAGVLLLTVPLSDYWAGHALTLRNPFLGLLLASVLIVVIGVLDDIGQLRGRHKFAGQVFAAAGVIAFGVQVESIHLFGWHVQLGALSLPFTLFFLLGAMNSLNFLDGMDGLLGSVGVTIYLALAAIALYTGKDVTALVALVLAASLLGFLVYNLPPATIYLGDCGSMFIGLTVGVLAIQSNLKGPATIALAAPTALLIIPIFDTTAAIVRRKLTGRSIYTTDRGHLHHCLLRQGMTVPCALLVVVGCCLVTVAGTLASLFLRNEAVAWLSALGVVCVLVFTRWFGTAELRLIELRVRDLFFPRPEGSAREREVRIVGSLGWSDLWAMMTARADELNLCRLHLDVNAPAMNEGYHATWERPHFEGEDGNVWSADVPLVVEGRIIGRVAVKGTHDGLPIGPKMGVVARLVEDFEAAAGRLTRAKQPKPRSAAAIRAYLPEQVSVP